MDSDIVAMMIGVSTFLGAGGLVALLWAVKTGQFDDEKRFLDAAKYDSTEDLRDAVKIQKRKDAARHKEKNYGPPD